VVPTAWPFIELNERGIAFIQGTRTKVTEIVECHLAYRWDAEQIHRQLVGLSLPQIHAALGYYYERKAELDARIAASCERSEVLRQQFEDSDLKHQLRGRRDAQNETDARFAVIDPEPEKLKRAGGMWNGRVIISDDFDSLSQDMGEYFGENSVAPE
jgi:uncharacterized protein (DUF433 family)